MPHPLVNQPRFTPHEWRRAFPGVADAEDRHRFPPMNCLSWIASHLAWHEQLCWLVRPHGATVVPGLDDLVGNSAPPLADIWEAWHAVTGAADPILDGLPPDGLRVPQIASTDDRGCNASAPCSNGSPTTTGSTSARRSPSANCSATPTTRSSSATCTSWHPTDRSHRSAAPPARWPGIPEPDRSIGAGGRPRRNKVQPAAVDRRRQGLGLESRRDVSEH